MDGTAAEGRPEVAVVGAGAAGAAAAYALRGTDATVTVFEKSRGVCGRAATRRRDGVRYDYGANYVKTDDDRVTELVTKTLPTEDLVEVEGPVWTFDADGAVSPGRDETERKLTWRAGITQLAKRLLAATDATVHRETRVETLARAGDGWRLVDDEERPLGRFDVVLLTPPAPQTAALLADADWPDDRRETMAAAVRAVDYRPVLTAVAGYGFRLDRPYYALVDTSKRHAVGWVSREECKPGHVPDGESVLVVQMGAEWSRRRLEDDPAGWVPDALDATAALLDDHRLRDPAWTDSQRWRYAHPESDVDEAVRVGEAADCYVAGDWVAGEGRVHAAVRSGLRVGERIARDCTGD
jgi:renalase